MARALRLCVLALVLLASMTAGQVPPAGIPPTDATGTDTGSGNGDYSPPAPGDTTGGGDYTPDGDYSPPSPDDFAPADVPPSDTSGDSSPSGDSTPPDPSTDTPTDPGTTDSPAPSDSSSYPPAPPGELPSKQDPATSGCRNEYHIIVSSTDECTSFCDRKIQRAKGEATVEPEVYESKLGAGTCCNCNYERTPGVINPNYTPDKGGSSSGGDSSGGSSPDTGGNLAGGSGTSPPAGKLPLNLDPAEFKPPTEEELMAAVNPTYVYPTNSKETNTYAVLRVTGGPFTLPLPFDQVLDFIYAFNNITGVAWQYKGDAPSVPDSYPAAPYGVPQVRNGPPPLPAPAASPPPAPVVVVSPPPPVVDPFAGVPPPAPIDPAVGLSPPPVDPSLAVPPPAPTFDSAAGAVSPPVDPNAAGSPPPDPAVFDPAADAAASPPVDGGISLPGISLPGAPPAPAARRRLLSSFRRPARRLLQAGGNGNYDFSPMQGYSPSPNPQDNGNVDPNVDPNATDNGNTDPNAPDNNGNTDPNAPDNANTDGNNQDVNADPLAYDGAAPPGPGDYNNGDSGNGDYSPPPPDGAYDGNTSPPGYDGTYSPPDGAYEPPPSPETVYSPPPVAPSPPPPEPPGLSAPPPAPPTPLPPNMDGIWYFSMYPLTDSEFLSMAVALNEATGEGSSAFLNFLTSAGIPATGVELRYIGQASEGQIDLTKRLDGDIFGAASSTAAAAPADSGSSMSTTTIAAIVGGVVGGVILIAIAGILVASNRRKSSKVQKEQLSQRWAMERELVEAEKVKLDASGAAGGYGGGGGSQSRINPAHTAGFVAMTNRDLDQQRSMRRAATMAAEARLSTLEPGVQPSPGPETKSAGGATPKPSRLESMRSALGLSKKGSGVAKPSGGSGSGSPAPSWSDSPTGGARTAGSPTTPTLRMQYSMGGTSTRAPSGSLNGAGAGGAGDAGDAPSPWGRMFSKK